MKALLLAAALAGFAAQAIAAQPVALRADIVDDDGLVTLGEVFDAAGAAGATPLARRTGATLSLDAVAVRAAAARAGLVWPNAEGLRRIVVRGPEAAVSPVAGPAAARGNVDILTYARNLAAGEMVQPQDLVWAKAAASRPDAPADADLIIGLAAKRPLRAGAAVSTRDVAAPAVIQAGEMITVTYDDGQIALSLQAKAAATAGVGDTISAQNLASKKLIQAVVTGPGQAVAGPAALALKTHRAQRLALAQ